MAGQVDVDAFHGGDELHLEVGVVGACALRDDVVALYQHFLGLQVAGQSLELFAGHVFLVLFADLAGGAGLVGGLSVVVCGELGYLLTHAFFDVLKWSSGREAKVTNDVFSVGCCK